MGNGSERMLSGALLRGVLFLTVLAACIPGPGQVNLPRGSEFRYLKGSQGEGLSPSWKGPGFDDSDWATGKAPFRYGDGSGGTVLSDMQFNYSVLFLRTTFVAEGIDSLKTVELETDYDDGFVVWINGQEVWRQNAPDPLMYDGFAPGNHESGTAELFEFDPGDLPLLEGENTLAVMAFNVSLTSTDFLLDVGLNAGVKKEVLADSSGLYFSIPPGFYDTAFYLDIVAQSPEWDILYTLDGSNPQISDNAVRSPGDAHILIDPESTEGRPAAPCVIVRASAYVDGMVPSIPETRSYIFLDRVLVQSYPGDGWPAGFVNEQEIDLEMDERVVNSQEYRDLMIPALLEVPSISVVTGPDNLFDPETGIYVNAYGHGHDWERECSAELINPDGSPGFNVNAGLRIRGGWSRHPEFAKHAFRLFFRSEYGDARLHYALFGEEGVDLFDKIDLRTAQNYAWSNGDGRNTFLRDVFSRDLQRDMGQPYTRSRFFHLYLNGMYWGLFQTQERSEARFASDYFGGKSNDYDVVKVDTEDWIYQIEATDGNLDLWYELYRMCNDGFSSNEDYYRLMGLDPDGRPDPGGRVYVDMDNLIDYMLSIFYTGNFDAPTSTFGWNKGPNNFYAIIDRTDPSRGFTFYNHDAEHCLFSDVADPGTGLFEDRVNLTKRTDGKEMEVAWFGSFHPQWLHQKLTANIEYRVRFMDRAFIHMNGEGAITTDQNLKRLACRESEIDTAIIAESARWGDARPWVTDPHTRSGDWIPEVRKIREDFIPYRTSILKDQLLEADLYSVLETPLVSVDGEEVWGTTLYRDGPFNLRLENTNGTGVLVYTTDGSDPRQAGGFIAPKANVSGSPAIQLGFKSAALVKARNYTPGTWSPLKEVSVLGGAGNFASLAITELHYHPPDTLFAGDSVSGKDLEFIEFKNTGEEAINLTGLVLDSAVYYEFPTDQLLPPGQFFVVASKPSRFFMRYGMIPSGNYQKNLSNSGEELLLMDSEGTQVMRFTYSDDPPWPNGADGSGHSLVAREYFPAGDPGDPGYWRSSTEPGGSPFADDPFPVAQKALPGRQMNIHLYPNPTSGPVRAVIPVTGGEEQIGIRIFNLQGRLLYAETISPGSPGRLGSGTSWTWSADLAELGIPRGLCLIRIRTNRNVFTGRIVLQ